MNERPLLERHRLRAPLRSPWPQAPAYHLPTTGSTMDDARRLIAGGAQRGALIVADYQRHGRGRSAARRWVSKRRANLLCNIVLDAGAVGDPWSRLPLLCGLAIAEAVERDCGVHCLVKWPNDVLLGGHKIAGVLCERHGRWYSVGFGVTCNQLRGLPQHALPAGSLRLITGRPVDRWRLLETVLERLQSALEDTAWRNGLLARLYGLGCIGRIGCMADANAGATAGVCATATATATGVITGVTSAGALTLADAVDGTTLVCHSGALELLGTAPDRHR